MADYKFEMGFEPEGVVVFHYRDQGGTPQEARLAAETLFLFLEIIRKRPLIEDTCVSFVLGGKGGKA